MYLYIRYSQIGADAQQSHVEKNILEEAETLISAQIIALYRPVSNATTTHATL